MKLERAMVLVDVIVGSIVLSVAITVVLGLTSRAITAQTTGEKLQTAAMLLDEQLELVLSRGADDYASRFDTTGFCDAPFADFAYQLDITGGQAGEPYVVRATVTWVQAGRERHASVETFIAPRLGDEVDPDRRPEEPVSRDQ